MSIVVLGQKLLKYFDPTAEKCPLFVLTVSFSLCRSRLGVHCVSSSSRHDAFPSSLGDILFRYDHPTGTGQ